MRMKGNAAGGALASGSGPATHGGPMTLQGPCEPADCFPLCEMRAETEGPRAFPLLNLIILVPTGYLRLPRGAQKSPRKAGVPHMGNRLAALLTVFLAIPAL